MELTGIGTVVENTINYININYNAEIDKYVIMPNHIHLIIILNERETGGHGNPPLHRIIGQLKSYTTKIYQESVKRNDMVLWQRGYYDHIIRDEADYLKILEYIDTNPVKWRDDCYFT